MKPSIAIPFGVAGILAAIGTAIANANGVFAGHPRLHYWFYGFAFAMIAIAVVGWILGTKEGYPDVSLVWDWTEDQKKAPTGLGLTESSKLILVHNRDDHWIYSVQLEPIQLSQTLSFDPIHEIGPQKSQPVVGRWNGRSSITTEYVYFFTKDENEAVAESKGCMHTKPHNRGFSRDFLRIPMKLKFQCGDRLYQRKFDLIYDQDGGTKFEKR